MRLKRGRTLWLPVVAAAVLASAVTAGPAAARPPDAGVTHDVVVLENPSDSTPHIVDGMVRGITQVGTRVVVGGTFTEVGPGMRGASGVVDLAAGKFRGGFPDVEGVVYAAVPDGSGGWFVGGSFSRVGGASRANAAHVDAAGAVSAWDPAPNGAVYDLLVVGGDVVFAGAFSTVAGQPAARIARVSGSSGALVWAGALDGLAYALAADPARVYVGGSFTKSGTAAVNKGLVAIEPTTGTLDPTFAPGGANLPVRDLLVVGETLYAAGQFTQIGGIARGRVAAVQLPAGTLLPFNPAANGTVLALGIDGTRLYIGGSFSTVAGTARRSLAGVDIVTGAVTALSVSTLYGPVNAVAPAGDGATIYVGGSFTINPRSAKPPSLAAVDVATNTAREVVHLAATPRSLARPALVKTAVHTLVKNGAELFVGGDFSDYGTISRPYLFSFDGATGAIGPAFEPRPNNAVFTVAPSLDGTAVFAGGQFSNMQGKWTIRVAKLALATGTPVAGFSARADKFVKDMAVNGDKLYLAGAFGAVNGQARSRLAAVDATTGALDPNLNVSISEPTGGFTDVNLRALDVTSNGSTLAFTGNFANVAGQKRVGVATIDLTTTPATLSPWYTLLYDYKCKNGVPRPWMRDLDIAPNDQYFVVVTSGDHYPPGCDTAVAFPLAPTGAEIRPLWVTPMSDTLEAVTVSGPAVYIGGHFRWHYRTRWDVPEVKRYRIAAIDPATGAVLSWNPSASGFRGVMALETGTAGLLMGMDGTVSYREYHGKLAVYPLR